MPSVQPNTTLRGITKETYGALRDTEKLDVLFDILSAVLAEHDCQIKQLLRRKIFDTVFSGVCGALGGAAAVLMKR